MNENRPVTVIRPKSGWFDLNLRELAGYKDLIFLFVKRNFVSLYKQTVLGPAWAVIQPLLTTVVFSLVFGNIAGLAADGVPTFIFYLPANVIWHYFSSCLTSTSDTFIANSGILGKVYFPRLVSPVSVVVSKLFRFSLQLATFIIVYLLFVFKGVYLRPTWYLLLFPVLLLMIQCLALGLGLIVSSLTTKYRDLTNFFGVFVSLWMYATPIVYPLSEVKNETLHQIMLINPMTAIIESFKYGAYGKALPAEQTFDWSALGISAAVILILLLIGVAMFNRKQKFFIDTI